MPKKSNSAVKKVLKPKISKVPKRPRAKKEENKTFQFEFDEFIIENGPERIKMFAKPNSNLQEQKQFHIKITKDKEGKAQFDIVFMKSTNGDIGSIVQGLSVPSEKDIIASITVSPEGNKMDLIRTPSYPSNVAEVSLPSASSSEKYSLPLFCNKSDPTLKFLETQYKKQIDHKEDVGNYIHISNINRYEKIRRQLLKEQRENLQSNGMPEFQNFDNATGTSPPVELEYNPKDFAENIETVETLPPNPMRQFPVSQLKSGTTESYIYQNDEGKQYLVTPLQVNDMDRSEPDLSKDSKYVPNGEFKKIHKKTNQVAMNAKSVQHVGVGEESTSTKNTGCGSHEILQTNGNAFNIDAGTSMEHSHENLAAQSDSSETLRSVVVTNSIGNISSVTVKSLRKVNAFTNIPDDQATSNPTANPEVDKLSAGDNELSQQSSKKIFPSEINFIITSACHNVPKPKQTQVREVVMEILDYFQSDLIKGLMATKIEQERAFIMKFMNHRGQYGLKKMEFINQLLQERSLSQPDLISRITEKINEINETIVSLLEHKIYEENTQARTIVERQLEKSKALILQETSPECFMAIKYCTLQSVQEQLSQENQLIRKEVELNLGNELKMTVQRVKSICGEYFP